MEVTCHSTLSDAELWRQYERMGWRVAHRYQSHADSQNTALDTEDLFMVGMERLISKRDEWNPERSAFSTFAWNCMKFGILNEINRTRWKRSQNTDDLGYTQEPYDPEYDTSITELDLTRLLIDTSDLTTRQKEVTHLVSQGWRDIEIASRLNLDPSSIREQRLKSGKKLQLLPA
jgi:RNA polymerase sigma factor (sigma-70 family)